MSFIHSLKHYWRRIVLAILAFFVVFLFGGLSTGALVQHSSETEFCVSCHEMQIVYDEYKQSSHFNNASGVRPSCSDCHIPRDWFTTLQRKMLASKDLLHHLLGTIDSVEKFESRRLHMAETVWARMKENDSAACRNCHDFNAMKLDQQRRRARKQHENAMKNGDSCIDCHKGIAHKAVHDQKEEENENDAIELQF